MTTACLLAGIAMSLTQPAFKGRDIDYRDGDTPLQGYVSMPKNVRNAPVVLVIHAWGGLGEYEKHRADMLADMGYIGFAVDIYGKGVRPAGAERGAMAGKYKGDRALYRSRLKAGLETATTQAGADKTRVAAIGYCFGGTGALELARSGAEVDAVVSFHGGLDTPTPEDAKNIKARVLVCHGAVDPAVPPAQVAAFQKEMEDAHVDYVFVAYSQARHSFTEKAAGNSTTGVAAYNENADRRSWEHMKTFLAEAFGK